MGQEKHAILTGGSQGIGKMILKYLLEANYQVAVLDKDEEALMELSREVDQPQQLMRLHCDVSSELELKNNVNQILRDWQQVDVLINNASIGHFKPISEMTADEWNLVLSTNLTSAFLLAKYLESGLRRQKGNIINICSTRAFQSEPHTEAYSASKGGLFALTHALAISLGPDVRVNAISPGWIDVSPLQKLSERQAVSLRETDHRQHPVGRVGRAEDVASLVMYLLSEDSGFITGQNFVVDGGMSRKMIYVE
ncbi:MAG: SDR family oxidoreductase [Bacteroidia bacterium]|nr:SDR family oxidoreductase [Bacteroidia bacterium]